MVALRHVILLAMLISAASAIAAERALCVRVCECALNCDCACLADWFPHEATPSSIRSSCLISCLLFYLKRTCIFAWLFLPLSLS